MVNTCSVPGCLSTSRTGKRFFRFPNDPVRSKIWIQATGRIDLEGKDTTMIHKSYRVCEVHFLASDIARTTSKLAVPTLKLPQKESTGDTLSKYTQTEAIPPTYRSTESQTGLPCMMKPFSVYATKRTSGTMTDPVVITAPSENVIDSESLVHSYVTGLFQNSKDTRPQEIKSEPVDIPINSEYNAPCEEIVKTEVKIETEKEDCRLSVGYYETEKRQKMLHEEIELPTLFVDSDGVKSEDN